MAYVPAYEELGGDGAIYHMVANVAVPDDASTLALFQTLQRQINALLAQKQEPLIDVDGRIGSKTYAAFLTLSSDPGSYDGTQSMAEKATYLMYAMKSKMDIDHTPWVADPVPSSPPSIASGGGVVNPPDDVIQDADGMSTTTKVVLAVGIGVIAAYVLKRKKRR